MIRTVLCASCSILLFFAAAGCSLNDLATPERRDRGLVIVLPGIEGPSYWNHNIARGLAEGGVDGAIEIYDWGTPVPGGLLINIADLERNRAQAARLRDYIVVYRRTHPTQGVHIIGHSGGGGIAVMAVEMLPEDQQVSTVILLAPALSPEYDLAPALRRTSGGIFNYYSQLDKALLGAGTTVAGTMDRKYTPAAGAVGFVVPKSSDSPQASAYRKLVQIEWSPSMRFHGNYGDHMGWAARGFVRRYIAPLIQELNGPYEFDRREGDPLASLAATGQ